MLHVVAIVTALMVIATGLIVIAAGDWHKFGLKFAAVALSTTAALGLLTADLIIGGTFDCPVLGAASCLSVDIYHVTRNVAFIIFHIATGRDAIHFKKRDRRGALCQKNSLKQPFPL